MDHFALYADLHALLGESGLLTDPQVVAAHNTDWRGRYRGTAPWVVQPTSTAQVMEVIKACAKAGVPLVPQGGNTSQCGAATPRSGHPEIILSLSRMNRILELDAENATLVCEAGAILAQVQKHAEASGFLFPLSLASEGSAQIGGVISTNAGGTAVLRYGNMRAQVLGLEVVLADGRCWNGLKGLRKDNTGYDLKQCFIGAEGTLGIITRAVLRLYPLPRQRVTAWLSVPSPTLAVRLLRFLRAQCGDRISAFELVSHSALSLVLHHLPQFQAPLDPLPAWSVLVELEEFDAQAPLQGLLEKALVLALEERLLDNAVLAQSLTEAQALWALREQISEAQKREGISIKHDISVPVSRIPEFIELAGKNLETAFPGIRVVCFGHVGDGNLHYNLSFANPERNRTLVPQTPAVNRIVHDVVSALNGSISAEHGIGQLKVQELVHYKDPVALDLMKKLKMLLDPQGLLNPGKILA
ncbi:FAD-binding oxidoreductase [Ferrovum myxofaciens]|uniref:FAD-binding oxidoreductase n=1 Tax=Ferrovum myxofaciens TaxID=416213 RepID=UPI000552B9ED|nr:FAD-binding oxidoreductase [Ferrovum myxofaciens]